MRTWAGPPRDDERSISAVPGLVWLLLVTLMGAQIVFRLQQNTPDASVRPLPVPPAAVHLRVLSMGEPLVLARSLNLWLQAFDHQPGISIAYARLDYERVRAWLDRIVALDPAGQYPFLAATRLYGAVRHDARRRIMLEWVYERYADDPARRWRWLAHAALVAKYQLDDLELALKYARRLTATDSAVAMPFWARDLSILILEDQCELEAAKVLIGGLLAEGHLRDPAERRFLERKLQSMDADVCTPVSGVERIRGIGAAK